MEAIPTTVPSINVRKLHPKPHHLRHLKPSLHLHHHPISVAGKPPTSISTKPTTIPSDHTNTPHHLLHPPPSRTQTHRNAATGYAAALIDAALSSNSLDAVYKDVKRLLKWLQCNEMLKGVMADPLVEEGVKGKVVKEVAEKGKLRRQVVAMVKMLVAKSKAGMVVQVMEEFEGIYYQLNTGLRVVV
ncbi:putative ATPase, OSCP/delta subunit, F1F0 ATP synthase OSCP/delta subunit domain superfamily [Helianthus debilis subsp. tardiflorus]